VLIEDFLPDYDARERHAVVVRASPERVYAALWSADLATRLTRALLWLRALPAVLADALSGAGSARRRPRAGSHASFTMQDVVAGGFTVIAEDPPRELILGVDGAFWQLRGNLRRVDAEGFRGPQPPGTARAAWSFCVVQRTDATCELSTETRVRCAIRHMMLRSVRRAAEG
jgi:hypothetical protein